MKAKKQPQKKLTASAFEALPDAEKERIYNEIDTMPVEEFRAKTRPLNVKERAEWRKVQAEMRRGAGRPRLGKNVAERVSISIEETLLARIDAYVKKHGKSRSEVFVDGAIQYIAKP